MQVTWPEKHLYIFWKQMEKNGEKSDIYKQLKYVHVHVCMYVCMYVCMHYETATQGSEFLLPWRRNQKIARN